MTEFKYSDTNFSFPTVNQSRTCYFKIKKPIEVWGNYMCPIAFYDRNDKLLYHNQRRTAHLMGSFEHGEFVKWSDDGAWAIFYEFERAETYDLVIINITDQSSYRINLDDCDIELSDINNPFSSSYIADLFRTYPLQPSPTIKERPTSGLFSRWKPNSELKMIPTHG